MLDRSTITTLLVTLIGAGLAVIVQRLVCRQNNWLRLSAAQAVTCLWGVMLVVAFGLQYQRLPPRPWTADVVDAEPWELMIWPVAVFCVGWPTLQYLLRSSPAWRMLLGQMLIAATLLAALAQAERFQALLAGNAAWALAALLAASLNTLTLDRLSATGAARWCLLVLLAQLLTITALVMTCFGSWGQWCQQVSLALGLIALVRLMVPHKWTDDRPPVDLNLAIASDSGISWPTWAACLSLPVSALAATILMHIRDYSDIALPIWLSPVVFLLPTLIGVIDYCCGPRVGPWLRVVIAALAAVSLSAVVVGVVIATGGASDEW